jgi:hypothetical protein
MTTRTFKQMGIAFGDQQVEIVAKIDNVVVYQGPVTTLNEAFPALPDTNYTINNELFSWTADVSFTGEQVIEIQATGQSTLLVADLRANYSLIANGNTIVSSGETGFMGFPYQQFGNTYINGTYIQPDTINHDSLLGQWWWPIPPNGNFVEHVNITAGYVGNVT